MAVHDPGEVGIELQYLSLVWRMQRPKGCRPSTVGRQAWVAEERGKYAGVTILTLFGSIVKDANTDVQYVNTTYPVLAKFAQ